jgi:hypothetical protein
MEGPRRSLDLVRKMLIVSPTNLPREAFYGGSIYWLTDE